MICQRCKQDKDPSAFTNRHAMSRLCDDCNNDLRNAYYASQQTVDQDAADYLAQCEREAAEYAAQRSMLPRLVKW